MLHRGEPSPFCPSPALALGSVLAPGIGQTSRESRGHPPVPRGGGLRGPAAQAWEGHRGTWPPPWAGGWRALGPGTVGSEVRGVEPAPAPRGLRSAPLLSGVWRLLRARGSLFRLRRRGVLRALSPGLRLGGPASARHTRCSVSSPAPPLPGGPCTREGHSHPGQGQGTGHIATLGAPSQHLPEGPPLARCPP